MLLITTVALAIILIILANHFSNKGNDPWDAVCGTMGAVLCIAAFMMILMAMLNHASANRELDEKWDEYRTLSYQCATVLAQGDDCAYSEGEFLYRRELRNHIRDWNDCITYYQNNQDSFWLGVFYPDVYDEFQLIEIPN